MAGGKKIRLPRLRGAKLSPATTLNLWAAIALLLLLGMLTTVIDLFHLPVAQTITANEKRQRAVIDATTSVVSLGTVEVAETVFDVATPKAAAAATAAEKPEETAPEEDPLPTGTPDLRTTPLPTPAPEMTSNKDSLVSAPAPEITETVEGLQLPKIGLKDAKPSVIYAQSFRRKPDQILLSIVVLDAGLDTQSIATLLAMPKEVTLAYSPYARNTATYAQAFRNAGHELWTMLPIMSDRFPTDDPGPMGLISRMPKEELIRRMHETMGAVVGSVGMVLAPGEAFTLEREGTAIMLAELSARGLLLLSTHPTRSVEQIAGDKKYTDMIARADMVLDPTPDESRIKSRLAGLLDAAREKGEYIVVLSGRPQTVQALHEWFEQTTIPEPITLAPLSAMYQPRTAPPPVEAPKEDGHGAKSEKPKAKEKPKAESKPAAEGHH